MASQPSLRSRMQTAAALYYERLPYAVQQEHRDLFKGLDKNGDGRISKAELLQAGYPKKSFFSFLDTDGDGLLDFEECKSLFFLMKNKAGVCDGCGKPLLESYYGCVECHAFDLCTTCYGARNKLQPGHPHPNFVQRKPMISTVMNELTDQVLGVKSHSSFSFRVKIEFLKVARGRVQCCFTTTRASPFLRSSQVP
ncbi:hypothetical protein KP509_14G042100 [Ceratopteris richardii]|uniref:EF-hand domain-containing protein n=1 Tax=Ceratopteris richardii TaxID=49495 RepID=A0A8T2T991_CERRI|nr:hypothetical protein KP509_14G042100 [Ceratopteris richardii]